ncbi:MAG: GTPase [Planctomycetota bacterium]
MWSTHELIVAPATVRGFGARSVVRLAGDGLEALLATLFRPRSAGFTTVGQGPRLVAAWIADEPLGLEWGSLEVEVLYWPGPAGPIGGPLAEVQLPCSPLLSDAIVAEACRHGARLARGGEFSLRAFLAGRLDLLQAEAVVSIVDARTPSELTEALDRMAGGVGQQLHAIRDRLLNVVADIEAAIDFGDERIRDEASTAQTAFWAEVHAEVSAATEALAECSKRLAARDAAATGQLPRVVLVGRPNIGKSSLFNALVGHPVAIVANESGTTRDWISARLEDSAAGVFRGTQTACMLVDIAGVGSGYDGNDGPDGAGPAAIIQRAAVASAIGEVSRADVVVVCRDASDGSTDASSDQLMDLLHRMDRTAGSVVQRLAVATRCDREAAGPIAVGALATSSVTTLGIDALRQAIFQAISTLPGYFSAATLRMRVGVDATATKLAEASAMAALTQAGGTQDEAIVASLLTVAIDSLGAITGAEIGTDILDRIFSRHCIGK